jgi:hypothetical protein
MRLKHVDDRGCIAGRFQYDMIVRSQPGSKSLKFIPTQPNAATGTQYAVFQVRDLGDRSRHIQTNDAHNRSPMEST